jgi:predicted ester cyclase
LQWEIALPCDGEQRVGTHSGDLRGLPATGKRLRFAGQTIYEMKDGQVAGHWQVVDRLGFVEQLRQPAPVT